MGRKAAVVTQAEVARAIRAAKQAGAQQVEVRPDGTILVNLVAIEPLTRKPAPVERRREIVL